MNKLTGRRPDFSQGRVHLTKERDSTVAFDVLKKILLIGELKGSDDVDEFTDRC
jgi:hypothetical protein